MYIWTRNSWKHEWQFAQKGEYFSFMEPLVHPRPIITNLTWLLPRGDNCFVTASSMKYSTGFLLSLLRILNEILALIAGLRLLLNDDYGYRYHTIDESERPLRIFYFCQSSDNHCHSDEICYYAIVSELWTCLKRNSIFRFLKRDDLLANFFIGFL